MPSPRVVPMPAATAKLSLPRRLLRLAPWVAALAAFLALVGYLHRAAYLQQLERNLLALPGGTQWWQEATRWVGKADGQHPRAIVHGRIVRVVRSYRDGRAPTIQAVELDKLLTLRGVRFWNREATLYIDLRQTRVATRRPPMAGDWWTVAILPGENGTTLAWMALPVPDLEPEETRVPRARPVRGEQAD